MREKEIFKNKNHFGVSLYLGMVALDILKKDLPAMSEESKKLGKRFNNLLQIKERIFGKEN